MTTEYNLIIETSEKVAGLSNDRIDEILEPMADYGTVLSRSDRARCELTLTVPAVSLRQAVTTGMALVQNAVGHKYHIVSVEAMTTKEFDERSTAARPLPMPDLVSVTEAAQSLGVSRQAVQQRIDAGTIPATRVGTTWVIPAGALAAVGDVDFAKLGAAAATLGAAVGATAAIKNADAIGRAAAKAVTSSKRKAGTDKG